MFIVDTFIVDPNISSGLLKNDIIDYFAKVPLSLAGFVRFARPFENDKVTISTKMPFSLAGLVRTVEPLDHDRVGSSDKINSLAHSTMDEFMPFVTTNMTPIYFRDLISVSTLFVNQIILLLGTAISNGRMPIFSPCY